MCVLCYLGWILFFVIGSRLPDTHPFNVNNHTYRRSCVYHLNTGNVFNLLAAFLMYSVSSCLQSAQGFVNFSIFFFSFRRQRIQTDRGYLTKGHRPWVVQITLKRWVDWKNNKTGGPQNWEGGREGVGGVKLLILQITSWKMRPLYFNLNINLVEKLYHMKYTEYQTYGFSGKLLGLYRKE